MDMEECMVSPVTLFIFNRKILLIYLMYVLLLSCRHFSTLLVYLSELSVFCIATEDDS